MCNVWVLWVPWNICDPLPHPDSYIEALMPGVMGLGGGIWEAIGF